SQSLVRGGSDDVRVRYRRRVCFAGHESGKMRHVYQVERANFVGDLAHAGEVNDPRIRAAAADDQLRTLALGNLLKIVVVDSFGFLGDAVRNDLVGFAGKIQMMPV